MFPLSGIQAYDIISTLQYLGMIKYWRGKHVILRKEDVIADYMERTRGRPKDKVNSTCHHQPLYPHYSQHHHQTTIIILAHNQIV